MITLKRFSPNHVFLSNFVRSSLVATRLCSDEKPILGDEQQQKNKNKGASGVKRKQKNKIFSLIVDEKEKVEAQKLLNLLMQNVSEQAEEKSTDQPSPGSSIKIDLPIPQKRSPKNKINKRSKIIHQLTESAYTVAKEFPGDVRQNKAELLTKIEEIFNRQEDKIKKRSASVPSSQRTSNNIEVLMSIDKVEKLTPFEESTEFSKEYAGLGIFTVDFQPSQKNEVKLKIWDELQKEELKALASAAPRNYFEELIQFTEEGKLWHFPIDNEQGLDEEAKVDFTEHIFLEEHLEPWCPKSGPLRHFMELVISGLSKNPYLTVQDKHEHIYWFRDYFEKKKQLLLSLGAYEKKSISEQ